MLIGLPDFSCFKIFLFQCFETSHIFCIPRMLTTN